jgi:hypothetical protein
VLGVTGYTGLAALLPNLGAEERDETRAGEYDELVETGEPAPTVGAGVA